MLATARSATMAITVLTILDTRPNGDCLTEVHFLKRAHNESEKEAIHLILTGIGDENLLNQLMIRMSTLKKCGTAIRKANNRNDNQTGQFGNQRAVNVVGARETVGGPVVQQSGIQCFNCKEFGHYAKECRKPKRVKDSTYHKEKMLLCKQAEKGVQLQAEQSDCLGKSN
ncbi:retrovirus-related pol polyprotein from transposon TNT 1-94 [Tanacetum coccineum]|uniref:Retrovirus-related pol polyprotein from transposon TNT 1-94 n=1 Tax=Tanacetum coccineum TaxID=301880 RepID=A0ABQ5BPL2_9ASTR